MNVAERLERAYEYYQGGNLGQAEHICGELLNIEPDNVGVLYCLAGIKYQKKNYDGAIELMKKCHKLNPSDAEVLNNLGLVLQETGQVDEAIVYYEEALYHDPRLCSAHYNLGIAFQRKEQYDKAISCYQRTLECDPDFTDAYYNLGIAFQENGQYDKATDCYQEALRHNPENADLYFNLGISFQKKARIDEAIGFYRKAIALNPGHVDVFNNLGLALTERGEIDQALTCYERALLLDGTYAKTHWNMALTLLLSGNFKQGWKEYEWRWKTDHPIFQPRNFSRPLWDGGDVKGITILLHAEQGFGDTIQFVRYAPLVAERGARVILTCPEELKTLVENVEGVRQVIAYNEKLPEFDTYCPLVSLPLVFDTQLESIPARIPYIKVAPELKEKWSGGIQRDVSQLNVGLVWATGPRRLAQKKSFPLATFSPLAQFDHIAFYSLQKGEAAKQAQDPPDCMKLIDYTEDIHDFSDTAAFIENLDLVISVDTAVAHLAGALGKPVWTLLPFAPDWRWMLNRGDSPWYPTMRLFRQPSPGDWESVITRVAGELEKSFNMHLRH